jgi:hypothetical protein
MSGRRVGLVVGIVAAIVIIVAVSGRRSSGRYLDPRSTDPTGAAALVELLDDLGADVRVSDSLSETAPVEATIVVLVDDLADDQRDAVLDRVDAGAVLVVTDPGSSLHGGPDETGGSRYTSGRIERGDCSIDALGALNAVAGEPEDDDWPGEPPLLYAVPTGDDEVASCFTDDGRAFVVAEQRGDGLVVATGGGDVFSNALLVDEDNAGLAAALMLGPTGDVTVLQGAVAAGEETLADLVPDRVYAAMALGAFAFVVYAIGRALRLGRPVVESLPVPIAGSELVVATGDLMANRKAIERATDALRADAVRKLSARHALAPRTSIEMIAAVVETRDGHPAALVQSLLAGPRPVDDSQLVQLANGLRAITNDRPQAEPDPHHATQLEGAHRE